MKKIIICLSILSIFILTLIIIAKIDLDDSSISKNEKTDINVVSKESSNEVIYNNELYTYLPKNTNVKLTYKGKSKGADFTRYVEYSKNGKVRFKTLDSNTTTTTTTIYELSKDELCKIYFEENLNKDSKYIEKSSKKTIILKSPIKPGNTWLDVDGTKHTITDVDKEITLPYGILKTVEVVTYAGNSKITKYFSKDLGLVKITFDDNNFSKNSELVSVSKNCPYSENFRIFYYDKANHKSYFKDKMLPLEFGISNQDALLKELNSPHKNLLTLVSDDIKINSIVFSVTNNVANIDLDEEPNLYKLSSNQRKAIILTLVNTIGYNFKVPKCYITVDGEAYYDGFYTVDTSKFIELK